MVIVAGGQGSRLAEVVGALPKALVPIAGKPILRHQLELAARAGVRDVTVCAGSGADEVETFVRDRSPFGLCIRMVREDRPLGTAGAVLQGLDLLPEHFFVIYGDLMADVDLQRMGDWHMDRRADFTVLAQPTDHVHDSDLLETDADDRITAIHTAPHLGGCAIENLANAALYVVRRDALRPFADLAGKPDFMRDVVRGLLASGGCVLAYRTSEYIRDMGTPERLQRVRADWERS